MKTELLHTNYMRNIIILFLSITLLTLSFAQRPKVGGDAQDFTLVDAAGEVISLSDLHGTPIVLNFWATWCVPCREELPFFQTTYEEINGISSDSIDDAETMDTMSTPSESEDSDSDTTSETTTETTTEATPEEEVVEDQAKNIHFVIVNNNEDAQKANKFLEEINISLTALFDASKDERDALADSGTEVDKTLDVVKQYRVRGMPTTFYIDADGVIQVIKQGLITPQSMQQDLAKIDIDWQPVIEDSEDSKDDS